MNGEKREIKINLVKLAFALQLAVFGLVSLDSIGFNIPIVRPAVAFIYLFFLPGLLILKILNIRVDFTKTILLSVGISLPAITLLSTLGSVVLKPFIDKPISEVPLTILMGTFVLLLIFLCWLRKEDSLNLSISPPPTHLLIAPFFLPILMVIGVTGEIYALKFLVLLVVSVIPLITLFKIRNHKLYPLFIWSITSSLMSLDLILEHKFNLRFDDQGPLVTEAVKMAGFWDPQFHVTHNSLLFPTNFPPVLTTFAGMDIAIGTRLISCVLISMIPVILYKVYSEYFEANHAFLAASLFAFYPFLHAGNTRTVFAFFFASIFLLILFSREIKQLNKALLIVIFAFSLILSHYGTAYMFMFLLVGVLSLNNLEKKFRDMEITHISPIFVSLFFVMAFAWYMYTSGVTNFNWGVDFGYHILTSIGEFFSPQESAAMHALVTRSVTPTLSLEVTKWLLFITFMFIIIGSLGLLYLYLKNEFNSSYTILTLGFCSILLGITQMGMPRIFGFSLLLTAPLAVLGVFKLLELIKIGKENRLLFFSVFLFILFAFTYGIVANSVNYITGELEDRSLHGMERKGMLKTDNLHIKRLVYWGWQPKSTHETARWIFTYHKLNEPVYRDTLLTGGPGYFLLNLQLPKRYGNEVITSLTQPKLKDIKEVLDTGMKYGYVFLGNHNVNDNFIYVADETNATYYKTSDYKDVFTKMNKIYANSGGIIYEK